MTVIGYQNDKDTVLSEEARAQHLYTIGQSGAGKSTFLKNLIAQDIQAGKGVGLIDPHGDLSSEILDLIPWERRHDLIYFDPGDHEHPVGFNPLENHIPHLIHVTVDSVTDSLKKVFADGWGASRMQNVLRKTLYPLVEHPHGTLLGVVRMLHDAKYRKQILRRTENDEVVGWWTNTYNELPRREQLEWAAPIENRVGQLLQSKPLMNILGQPKSTVNIQRVMDEGKIFIGNLGKHGIGSQNASLLGSFLMAQFEFAAMSRGHVPEDERRPFYLYVDEFQNFASESFKDTLSEARKFRLTLHLAHQFLEQIPEQMRAAIFGNVGVLVVFKVGVSDRELFKKEFRLEHSEFEFLNRQAWVRLSRDHDAKPISTYPPPDWSHGGAEHLIRISRHQYTRPRALVEARIKKWREGGGQDPRRGLKKKRSKTL